MHRVMHLTGWGARLLLMLLLLLLSHCRIGNEGLVRAGSWQL